MRQIQNSVLIGALGVLAGCQTSLDVGSVDLASMVCSTSATRLLAGQSINVGTVNVTQDERNLCVSFQITNTAWRIRETHLALASSPSLLPQTGSGNPQVGQFPYHHTNLNALSDQFCIDYVAAGYSAGQSIYVAAHAVVVRLSGSTVVQSETAWGEGDGFTGRNWAMYFNHTLESCNHAPVAVCQDIVSECPSSCEDVNAGSYDPDGADDIASITCQLNEDGTAATIVVTDQSGLTSACTGTIDLSPCAPPPPPPPPPPVNAAPVAVCNDIVSECPSDPVSCDQLDGGSYDPDGAADVASRTCSFSADGSQATLTITDLAGLSSSCTATLTSSDTSAPQVSTVPFQFMPEPYNYALVEYSLAACIAAVTDNCGGSPVGNIEHVSSDEPVLIGNHPECADPAYAATHEVCQDIQILDDTRFRIRNTRDSVRNGRVYTVTFSVSDAQGNTSSGHTCQFGVRLYGGQIPEADAPAYTIYR